MTALYYVKCTQTTRELIRNCRTNTINFTISFIIDNRMRF